MILNSHVECISHEWHHRGHSINFQPTLQQVLGPRTEHTHLLEAYLIYSSHPRTLTPEHISGIVKHGTHFQSSENRQKFINDSRTNRNTNSQLRPKHENIKEIIQNRMNMFRKRTVQTPRQYSYSQSKLRISVENITCNRSRMWKICKNIAHISHRTQADGSLQHTAFV